MNQVDKYYEHSGVVSPIGVVYMTILGVVGAVVFAIIYGYATFYIPFIYLNFFLTLGLGIGVGLLVGFGGKFGKVRNSKMLLIFGFIFGLFAEYANWVSWIFAYSKEEILILNPSDMINMIQLLSENGAWSIFGWTPTGVEIYAIWGIEAVIIIGTSTIVALSMISSTPFCETCTKWVEEKISIFPLTPINNPSELVSQLEQGDYSSLKTLEKSDTKIDAYTQIDLLQCPTCQQSNFLTIKSIIVSKDDEGKEEKNENILIENLIITNENYKIIKEQW